VTKFSFLSKSLFFIFFSFKLNLPISSKIVKELFTELKRLEKQLQEIEPTGNTYANITNKVTRGKQSAEVEMEEKKWGKLVRTYRETKLVLTKADRACGVCVERLQRVKNEKKRQREGLVPGGKTVGGKKYKGANSEVNANVIPVGRQVAARVSKDRDFPEEWILASIVCFYDSENKYEVEDEDPGDESDPDPIRKHHKLAPQHIIPLPEHPEKAPEYTKGSEVLAMFPNTTSFYKATVVAPPKPRKHVDYILKFADDDDEKGETPARKVKPKYVLCKSASNAINKK